MYKKVKPQHLNIYLKKIDALFPEFRSKNSVTIDEIERYYAQSYWGYAVFHSWSGAVHMALSPNGKFSKSDYFRQAEEVGKEIEKLSKSKVLKVLEIGCGRGFNIRYLAQSYEALTFVGIDISKKNLAAAERDISNLSNASVLRSDFHTLSGISDESIDLVFAVETLCHAIRLEEALGAISRVLVKGGKLIVFDGFRGPQFQSSPEMYTAVEYAEKAMAVPSFRDVEDFVSIAKSVGLNCEYKVDRSREIVPNLVRLSDLAKGSFKIDPLSEVVITILPRGLVANAVAGLLMAVTVQCEAHKYIKLCFEKS
jgi:arsenite methyltransferase